MATPPEELHAARTLATLLGLKPEKLDGAQSGSGLPDFRLRQDGRPVGVLEVTRWADFTYRATAGPLSKNPVLLPGPQHDWHARLQPDLKLSRLRRDLPGHVVDLENRSIEVVSALHPDRTWRQLQAFGVLLLKRGEASSTSRLFPTVVAPGGKTSREILADIAEAEVSNNLVKLQSGSGPERHLWVWIEYDGPDGADAMVMSMVQDLPGPPPRAPRIPVHATLWLGVDALRAVVSWNATRGWKKYRPPPPKGIYDPDATMPHPLSRRLERGEVRERGYRK